jgi:AraC-like DNA-binding protein
MTTISIIVLIGAIQGFFLSLLFFLKKNILFHKLFALILFSISLALLFAYLQNVLDYKTYPFLIKTTLPLSLVFIPGLLIYLKKLAGSCKNQRITTLLLFLPFFAIILYNLPFYFGSNEAKVEYFIRNDISGNPLLSESLEGIFVEFMVTLFSLLAIVESGNYKKRVKQIYSNLSKAKSNWIQFLAFSMFVMTLFSLILSVGRLLSVNAPLELNFITAMGATVAIYYIAYYLLFHPDVFSDVSLALQKIDENFKPNKEIKKESSGSVFFDFEKKIIHLLENETLYSNPDLTLDELAGKIGIPPYLTSKVLSQNLNTNFYSIVNKYRLQKVKQELLTKSGKSIIEIAYNAGFNSKTSFYETFKKETGISPSEFIKKHKSEMMSG